PVPLTMWHVYGSLADSPMNDLVNRFNKTLGREKGIIINVTSTFTTTSIRDPLLAAARELPGAGTLPDMFMAYPRDMLAVGPEKLMDWTDKISPERLAEYVPAFIEEGMHEGKLFILPIAKSTSALFVNATIFDRFSAETGVGYEDLSTWEGMFKAAAVYYEWSGGKAFYKHDDWWHYCMLSSAAFDAELFQEGKLDFDSLQFQRIWKMLARSAVFGHVCLMNGYATTAMMTGDTVCGIESSASILYYKDRMTLPDNTTMPLRLRILPVPEFRGGKSLAIQRGSGLAVRAGDPKK
ncbi:MAG: extracellular solute-binding protein, partial [Desulfovibrionaceae bacterium]|nr:extracellular solute-binding protein [Desulfovibrionaceae bacterium]